jgi:hypothetical protein
VESIPFLREAISARSISLQNRQSFEKNIQNAVVRHLQKNKDADAEKLMAFLKELGIPEPQVPPKNEDPKFTITPKSNPVPTPPAVTNETAQANQDTPSAQPEKTSSRKTILWLAVIALFAAIGGVATWRKKK